MTFLLFKFSKWKKLFLGIKFANILGRFSKRTNNRVDQRNCLSNEKLFFQNWLHEGQFVASIFGDWELLLNIASSTKSLRILIPY
jgi:hypothetical protein